MEQVEDWRPKPDDVEINKVLWEFPLYTPEQVQLEVAARGFKVTVERVIAWQEL